jgi:inner membrane protein
MCHILLMMPVLGLPIFWLWPMSVAAPIYAIILLLSVWLYILTIRVMKFPVRTGGESMLQMTGEVIASGTDGARVRIGGENWSAVSSDELRDGDRVKVTQLQGLTLTVRRIDQRVAGPLGNASA